MIKLILPLLLCISLSSLAQENTVLKGQISNDVSDKDFISVINLSLEIGTVTDNNGAFEIPAQVNDIIDISALQFKNLKFIVTEKMINQGFISITLELETTILPEITLSSTGLSGDLGKDIGAVVKKDDVEMDFLGDMRRVPTPAERRLYTATTRGNDLVEDRADLRFDIPLNAVFNAISGQTKKMKTRIDQERALRQIVALENKFAPDFFTDALEIEISKIEDFLFYAQAVNDTVYNHQERNALELVEALVKEAAAYKALHKI